MKILESKFLVLVMILVLTVPILVGCNSVQESSDSSEIINRNVESIEKDVKHERDKSVLIAVSSTFTSMDPHDTNDNLSYSVQKSMMQGLVGFNKEMKVIPVLAKSYESNGDATEFIFKLHENIKFHDGTKFNSYAVKVNIDRLSNQENKLKRNSLFSVVDRTEIIDEYTVKIILKEPFGAMINTLAHPAAMIHSPSSLEKYGKEVARHPIGTGPFVFKEWIPGDHLTVLKNKDYWKDGYPKVESITFKPVPENGSRIAMLQTGEADFIYPVPTEQAQVIMKNKEIILESKPSISVTFLSMNTMKKPFDDIRVRKAINYAIDKEAYIKVVRNGYGEKAESIIAKNTQFYSPQKPYDYNLEKAKQLLNEAGYEKGFEIEVWGNSDSSSIKGMEFLQQQLAQVNIKLNIVPLESGIAADKVWSVQSPEDAEVQTYYIGWSPSTGDADWGIRPLFATESMPPYAFNIAYYSNKEADRLIQEAIETADIHKRSEAYSKVQEIIWNDAPWVFLEVGQQMAGRRSYLEGIYVLPDGCMSVEDAEIK